MSSELLTILASCTAAAVIGTVAGMLAARHVHRSLLLEVSDMLEKVAWLYDRIRKRVKVNGEAADLPAVALRPQRNADINRWLESQRRGGR